MNKPLVAHRMTATSLVACLALAVVAPAAQAGQGRGSWNKIRRYEVGSVNRCDSRPVVVTSCAPPARVVRVVHSSSGGGALAGFIGGLAIGAILSNAQQSHAQAVYTTPPRDYCPPPNDYDDGYYYEDPYSHERFASLELYLAATRHGCGHPRIARVIEARTGVCVHILRYEEGHWDVWDDGGDDEGWDE